MLNRDQYYGRLGHCLNNTQGIKPWDDKEKKKKKKRAEKSVFGLYDNLWPIKPLCKPVNLGLYDGFGPKPYTMVLVKNHRVIIGLHDGFGPKPSCNLFSRYYMMVLLKTVV